MSRMSTSETMTFRMTMSAMLMFRMTMSLKMTSRMTMYAMLMSRMTTSMILTYRMDDSISDDNVWNADISGMTYTNLYIYTSISYFSSREIRSNDLL